ncbi:MAG: ribose 5-phosphate isomerase B [Candidatus Omnitrophica bacterium]|nr:ribose 5-phosphate isomerase B [Candidatus Omnitrophota bacterium]
MSQKVSFGCDHRGFEIKKKIIHFLKARGYEIIDCGCDSSESVDYPDHILKAAELVRDGKCFRGVGVCYTGIGSSIAANKVRGVRAALVHDLKQAQLTRAHNDSNMLILGAGFLEPSLLGPILEAWFSTPFEGGRHEQRVHKITQYERDHEC